MNKSVRPRGLGRGLDVLLPLSQSETPTPARAADTSSLFICALERLTPCRSQPRQHFDPTSLDELAQSIREHGLLEPIVVRRISGDDRFEIVAGERRWRAA